MPEQAYDDSAAAGCAHRRPGRPRDASRDEAIVAATLELLGEIGYDRLSMDAVAARAGAGKATVYRRWPGKAELVVQALTGHVDDNCPEPDTGTLRGDLQAMAREMVEGLHSERIESMIGMISAIHRDPALAHAFREGFVSRRRAALRLLFERSVARGELRPGLDLDLLTDLLPAVVFHRLLVTGGPVDDGLVDRLLDQVIAPLSV